MNKFYEDSFLPRFMWEDPSRSRVMPPCSSAAKPRARVETLSPEDKLVRELKLISLLPRRSERRKSFQKLLRQLPKDIQRIVESKRSQVIR
jgi:hypothetical protein